MTYTVANIAILKQPSSKYTHGLVMALDEAIGSKPIFMSIDQAYLGVIQC